MLLAHKLDVLGSSQFVSSLVKDSLRCFLQFEYLSANEALDSFGLDDVVRFCNVALRTDLMVTRQFKRRFDRIRNIELTPALLALL